MTSAPSPAADAIACRLRDFDLVYLTGAPWNGIRYHKQIWCERLVPYLRRVFYFENVPTRSVTPRDLLRAYQRTRPAPEANGNSSGVRVIHDLLLPEPIPLVGVCNEVRMRRMLRRLSIEPGRTIVITNAPGRNVLHFLQLARPALILYDCDHNYEDCPWVPRAVAASELDLVRRADGIVCDSQFLCRKWASRHPAVVQIPPAVDERQIAAQRTAPSAPAPRVIAYFGTLRNDIDIALLNCLAARFRVLVIGAISQDLATPLSATVSFIRCVSQTAMFEHLKQAEALVLPYRLNPYTAAVLPAKVFEALATGLPVVVTPLPELEPYREYLYRASTPADFIGILESLPLVDTLERKCARLAAARANTWDRRCAELLSVMGSLLKNRRE